MAFIFPLLGMIIPTDFHIFVFFRGVGLRESGTRCKNVMIMVVTVLPLVRGRSGSILSMS